MYQTDGDTTLRYEGTRRDPRRLHWPPRTPGQQRESRPRLCAEVNLTWQGWQRIAPALHLQNFENARDVFKFLQDKLYLRPSFNYHPQLNLARSKGCIREQIRRVQS
jgi:hypothetical protein